MANPVSALQYLIDPKKTEPKPVTILFGDDAFLQAEVFSVLRNQVLPGGDAEFSLSVFDGKEATFSDVLRELATQSMFGDDGRLVRVTDADSFASRNGPELEDYLDSPSKSAVLLLQMTTCAANTRLYKKTLEKGLLLDAKSPTADSLAGWLTKRAKDHHALLLDQDAAQTLVELIGPETGLLDQELARLAVLRSSEANVSDGAGTRIDREFVERNVGAWRLRKVWDMIDAVLLNRIPDAIHQLDLLLAAGETPVGVLAQCGPTLRRFATATTLFLDAEKTGKRLSVDAALQAAKIPPFALRKSVEQMKRLGRLRGGRISALLLETDLALKGGSRADPRVILERFLLQLGHPNLREG